MRPNWPKNSQNCSEERLWGCLQLAKMFQAASERCLGTGIIDSVIFKQCFVRNESLYKFWGALEGSQKHLQSFPSPVCENLSDDLKGNLKWHTNKFVCCAATYLGEPSLELCVLRGLDSWRTRDRGCQPSERQRQVHAKNDSQVWAKHKQRSLHTLQCRVKVL